MNRTIPPVAVWLILLVTSAGLLVGAGALWKIQEAGYAVSVTSMGTVVEMVESHGQRVTYSPIVEFVTSKGETISFHHPVTTSPPKYRAGQHVRVIYQEDDPRGTVMVDDFLWKFQRTLMLLGTGLVLGLVSGLGLLLTLRANAKRRWFRTHGKPVQATKFDVRQHRSGNKVYQLYTVRASWQDPDTNHRHLFVFESKIDKLDWKLEDRETITVYMDPDDASRYWMDLEGL